MTNSKVDILFSDIKQFSDRDIAYQQSPSLFEAFYDFEPSLSGFEKKIEDRLSSKVDRELLRSVLSEQYRSVGDSAIAEKQIQRLSSENTYTIVTAHQPSLFTGPLYYISKIASCIKLSRILNKSFPDYHIIPVFVHGGEDHDFEEVNHLNLYNNKLEWKNKGTGAVGRFSVDGLKEVQEEVLKLLEREANIDTWKSVFDIAIQDSSSYSAFVFKLVHGLFGHTELLQLSMDNKDLKRSFIPSIKKELLQRPSKKLVLNTQELIQSIGYKAQAFPREINLFLHNDQGRNRIEFENGTYKVVDTSLEYTEDEILELLERSPESFSPNVVMRPLYQEHCLPNLAYIGGGGELAYWLERKSQFKEFNMSLPVLMRRDSYLYLNKSILKNIDKLGMSLKDFFPHIDEIIYDHIDKSSSIDIDLSKERAEIKSIYDGLADKAKAADPTLSKLTLSEYHKQIKAIDSIESRIKRAYKAKEEVTINKLRKVKESIFPANSLQERKVNFLQFYARYGASFLEELIELSDPLDPRVKIFKAELLNV